ncbi:MAG: hypothetical protein ACFFB2_08065 [Promethearchaeota archaeon]
MVSFCEICGSILIPKPKKKDMKKEIVSLFCNSCKKGIQRGSNEISYLVKTKIPHRASERLTVIESTFDVLPTIRNPCPRCDNHEAYYWEGGDRRKPEWESMTYYKCKKCSWIWFE